MVQASHDIDETPLEEYNDLPDEDDPKGTRCYYWSVSARIASYALMILTNYLFSGQR